MDSGASHNLMPKIVMEELGLEVTKAYHDLYSFDSRRVQCLGVIKDLVVSLFQLPMKSVVMDIVVADVPPKFDMLLSRSWIKKLGGTLQMDLTYATIPVFGGEHRRLYREAQMAYIVSDEETPPIILSLHLTLIWGLVYCSSLILLKPLFKSERNPYLITRYLLQPPLFGRCSSTELLLAKALALEWFLCHLVRKPYPCHTS
jgi:hypothetical protein